MPRVLDCRDPAGRAEPVAAAASLLQRGRIAAVPDESMYMLLADAFSDYGVNRLRLTKGHSHTALTVLVGAHSTVAGIAAPVPDYARDLMAAFWPGPLTLILRQQPTLSWPLTAPSVPVRMPLHPLTLDLVGRVGPSASTSANRIGLGPAHDAAAALSQFDTDVDVYLDAGPAPLAGSRSTVVDATGPHPVILRHGAITAERIEAVSPALELGPD